MWPLKTTARGAEIRWRWFRKSLWTHWGHFGQFRGHFGAILGPFWANLWPRTQNCCRLVMWPLKTTARGAEFWWRWFRKSLWRHWGHFRQFWGHFGVISGPFLTLKSNSLQTSLVTTQNDCKRSRMQMKMVLRFNSKMFRSFWGLKWRQMTLKWPGNCRKVLEMASMSSRLLLKSSPSEFCFSCGRFEWSHD